MTAARLADRVPPLLWDVALALGVAGVGLLPSGHEPRWGYPAAVAAGLVLVVRRRRPHVALIGTFPALIGMLGTVAAGAALYALGKARPGSRTLVPWLALTIAITLAPVVYQDVRNGAGPVAWGDWVVTVLVVVLITGGPLAAGVLTATRTQLADSLAALRATEADRDAAVAARVRAEERNRIATEVHDIVGHYAALIAVQAGALEARAPDPETKGTAARLRELSSDALDEMRSAVALWQHAGDRTIAAQDWLPLVLQPAVAARESGVRLHVDDGAEPRGAIDQVTLRVLRRAVQEGVTNAVRHCPGSRIEVTLVEAGGTIRVEVRNPASSAPAAGTAGGSGLTGLGERVRQLGGSITAGPTDTGDWLLTVTLDTV